MKRIDTKRCYPHLKNEVARLRAICMDSLHEQYGEELSPELMGRLSKELAAINDTEMTGVFLILRELINRSKLKSYERDFAVRSAHLLWPGAAALYPLIR